MLLLFDRLFSFGVNIDNVSQKILVSIPNVGSRTLLQKAIVRLDKYFLELAMVVILIFATSMALAFFMARDSLDKSIFSGIWAIFSFIISVISTFCSRLGNKL